MIGNFLGSVVGYIAQRYPHFRPGFAVNIVKTHLGGDEDTALGHLLPILFRNIVDADHGVAISPLLISDLGIALAKLGTVAGYAGFFDLATVGPAHSGP